MLWKCEILTITTCLWRYVAYGTDIHTRYMYSRKEDNGFMEHFASLLAHCNMKDWHLKKIIFVVRRPEAW